MSSTERNKVKSFGDPSIDHGEMADRFLIVGAFNAPPLLQIGLRDMISKNMKTTKKLKNYFLFTTKLFNELRILLFMCLTNS